MALQERVAEFPKQIDEGDNETDASGVEYAQLIKGVWFT